MIEVINDFLLPDEDIGMSQFFSYEFPWFLGKPTEKDSHGEDEKYNYHFSHVIYDNYSYNSEYWRLVSPILQKLNPAALIRIKANLTTCGPKIIEHGYHIDNEFAGAKTAVFYVNTNDGYTCFQTGEIVYSLKNRLCIFPSELWHSGTNCTDTSSRVVININYFPKK